ncbi:hypothetical protein Scep_026484 [Stephania cephalantha]|uniref:Uncharacterized protein n=1 Tax=Stephania cephalantha TaxID=152367 RepID=A0AAP0EMT2_9MAGN
MRLMSFMNSPILLERFLHPAAVDHTSGYASTHSPKSSSTLQHVPSSRQQILNFLRMHVVEFSQIDARALSLAFSTFAANSTMASYFHNYGRFEDSYYYGANGVEEKLEVSSHKSDIIIALNKDDETEKEIGVISKRSEEPQIESEEDQLLVLVKPPTISCILVKPYKGVERSVHIFSTLPTPLCWMIMMQQESFVLEVSNELPSLEESMHVALPKAIDAPFVVDISKGAGIT